MVTFQVEDGTGRSDATSYVTKDEARDYWQIHDAAYASTWDGLTDDDGHAALNAGREAVDHRYEHRMKGERTGDEQALAYPRRGVSRYNRALPSSGASSLPVELKHAQVELARRSQEGTELSPDIANPAGIKRKKQRADTVEQDITYVGSAPPAGTPAAVPTVDALMRPLLKAGAQAIKVP